MEVFVTHKKDKKKMPTGQKFDFRKLDFDEIREREREEARRRLQELERKRRETEEKAKVPPPKTYSVEEHEAAKQDAFEKGKEVGFNQATETQNKKIETLLENHILPQTHKLVEEDRLRLLKQEQDMVRIAFAVVKKILPHTLKNTNKDEIDAFITENLPLHADKTKMTIRVPVDILEDARKTVHEVAEKTGISCDFTFVADETIGIDGCRLEWSDGGIERRTDDLMLSLEKLFGRFADKVGQEEQKERENVEVKASDDSADKQTQDADGSNNQGIVEAASEAVPENDEAEFVTKTEPAEVEETEDVSYEDQSQDQHDKVRNEQQQGENE